MNHMNLKTTLIALVALTTTLSSVAQPVRPRKHPVRFKQISRNMPAEWYGSAEGIAAADSVLKYQFPSGGWGKNMDWHKAPEGKKIKEKQQIWEAIHSKDGVGATIDNGATTTEMLLLAKVYDATKKSKYKKAFVKGLNYLLEAQYENGGWPQFYPFKPANKEGHPFYSNHITFNDDAMYLVMKALRDIYEDQEPYAALKLSDKEKARARSAYKKGIDCILKCQIKKNGKLTVWCQQHDEHTFEPAGARSYEHPSFTACNETSNIIKLLMDEPNPSDEIVNAVTSAIEWLKAHALKDVAIEEYENKDGKYDRRLVHKFGSEVWARYYDLETEEPYVCDRDGIKQPGMEYISYERRIGYGWYGTNTQKVISQYPKWLKKVRP